MPKSRSGSETRHGDPQFLDILEDLIVGTRTVREWSLTVLVLWGTVETDNDFYIFLPEECDDLIIQERSVG